MSIVNLHLHNFNVRVLEHGSLGMRLAMMQHYIMAESYILYIVSCPIEKLGVEASTVQHGVEGLMYLLTECSKLMVRNT